MPHGRCTRNSARSAPLSANGGAASANSRWEESCGTRVLCHAALGAASLGFVEAGLQPSVQFIFVAQALLPGALRVPHAPVCAWGFIFVGQALFACAPAGASRAGLCVGLYLCGTGTLACAPAGVACAGFVWGFIFVAQAFLPVSLLFPPLVASSLARSAFV